MEQISGKISVIIPVFNAEQTLEDCLDSLSNQTYTNFDIILVNDGSTDNSLTVIKKLQEKESRIKCINTKNGGVSTARNIGLSAADGEFIAFLDADDRMHSTMLEKMHQAITEYVADVAVCRYATDEKESPPDGNIMLMDKDELLQEMMLPKRDIAAFVWNRLYRAKIIKENHIQFDKRIKVCEDTLFNFMVQECCKKIVVVDVPLYCYRINSEGAMFKPQFNKNKLTANVAYEYLLMHVAKGAVRDHIEIACMLYNEILLFQVYKYKYKLDKKDRKEIKRKLRLAPKKFLRSEVDFKYKLAYVLLVI